MCIRDRVLCVAESPVITIFLQQHFVTRPNMRLAFDDVELVEVPLPPATCADAKSWIPGLQVSLKDVVVTGRWEASDFSIVGYVEDPDRKAGIRLSCSNASDYIWDSSLGVGANVDVAGVLQINANNELEIAVKSITASAVSYTHLDVYKRQFKDYSTGRIIKSSRITLHQGNISNYIFCDTHARTLKLVPTFTPVSMWHPSRSLQHRYDEVADQIPEQYR